MGLPYPFVLNGKKPLDQDVKKKQRLIYSCRESRPQTKGNCKPGIGAYTSKPDEAEEGMWTITFCDKFWEGGYAEEKFDPAKYPSLKPSDLNGRQAYEQTLIHEYFHVVSNPPKLCRANKDLF